MGASSAAVPRVRRHSRCPDRYVADSATRAGLSLLGHCYYQSQDFIEASNCYEMLCDLCPEVPEYKLYYAQSLYQAGLFEEALKVISTIEVESLREKVLQLQSAIYFSSEDYTSSQAILMKRQSGTAQTLNDEGCMMYQANLYEDALQRFLLSLQTGFNPLTAYNIALCHYRKKEFSQSLNMIGEIIERGIRNYPELGIGAQVIKIFFTILNINFFVCTIFFPQ